ncbi:NAD(P)/FAD-dependent oxidoreductase [Aquabacterium sp. OR-4]|uniref:NAD(P)/FAD-dependent oxidoreductase n=1 Tax=Aquabacterium sp. OR-4 TaxID=2978127 RepID=UPI0021B30E6D|nr:NAD(P)/FAD-dependent oxidoreductase [Aquabacterium sp. OR-4]MDT7834348.1 NAD(P)/FAD-dependent oxidoreductase [Aquabacterium sp. OR-4]
MDSVECVVIGAGVVGLAVARALAQAGREVVILEAENAFGTVTSARNSEVIHAGIYYPPGSRRAALCVRGKALLYDFCASHGVAHQRCGKLIVAGSADELPALAQLQATAAANGVHDLQALSAAQAQALEPALACVGALLSPSTGIVDSHGLMLALLGDAEAHGAALALCASVIGGQLLPEGGAVLDVANRPPGDSAGMADNADKAGMAGPGGANTAARTRLRARLVVNAAGLGAPALARRIAGMPLSSVPQAHLAKGCYFTLPGRAPFSRLVYPAPGHSGHLGVHLTLDLGGQARFGPSFEWVQAIDYTVDAAQAAPFYDEVRRYWPGLPDGVLQPGYAGMRPKISGPGEPAADFRIDGPEVHGAPGWVNLFGIESPGLTASLAIAEVVAARLAPADNGHAAAG